MADRDKGAVNSTPLNVDSYGSPTSGSMTTGVMTANTAGSTQGSGWFGPLSPLAPIAPPQVAGRQFDIPQGVNVTVKPRQYEQITFEMLRHIADGYDFLRMVIETRKDQMDHINVDFRAKEGKNVPDSVIDSVRQFFDRPDGEHTFAQWRRMINEDLLVLDAPTIYRLRDMSGAVVALLPLDGGTIKRVVDDWGRTPMPYTDENGTTVVPPAYQQVLKGMPAVDYTYSDLIYFPRNPRTHKMYGYSPVEQIVMSVNIALRRQLGTLDYYTEGNIPSALLGVPETWTPDHIRQFQDYWDSYFTGDLATRRRLKFVPGAMAKSYVPTKEPELQNTFDEWLAKIICYAFSVSPQAFTHQVNRATATTQKQMADEEGLQPLLLYWKNLIDTILSVDFGLPDVECIMGDEQKDDPAQEAVILGTYVDKAIMTRNEARDKLGLDPVTLPEADELGFTTATGFVYLDASQNPDPIALAQASAPSPPGSSGKQKTQKMEKRDTSDEPRAADGKWTSGDGSGEGSEPPKPRKPGEGAVRDEFGRFKPSGQPNARQRRKMENAKKAEQAKVVRDEMGRFKKGKVTKEQYKSILSSITAKVIFAGIVTGIGVTAAAAFKHDSLVGRVMTATASSISRSLVMQAADLAMATVFRTIGMSPDVSKKMARATRNLITGLWYAEKMQKDDDSGSDDDLDADEMALCRQIATEMVPDLVPRLQRALISYLEEDGIHGQQLSEIETALNSSLNEIVPKLASLGKLSKSSGWRKIEPVDPTSYSNKAVGQHLHSHLQSVLADVGKRVTEHIRNSLAHFGKADDDPAASIASNADLSGLLEINLGDDLSEVAGDSSYRTLTRLGVGDDSDTMDEAISSSENLSRARSESIVKGTSSSPQDDYNITQSTRDMIQRIVSSGLAAGKTSDEITSDVNDQVFGSDRAGAISDYELANASTIGTMQALESASDAGLNLMKGWLTAGDSRVDEDICRENERQGPIPLDQAFQSGHMAPLGHPGCRCALVGYVASDSE